MKVDFKELQKQRYESIVTSGEFCGVDVLIGKGEKDPIANVAISNVSSQEVALLIASLEEVTECLKKKYPLAKKIRKKINIDREEIDFRKNGGINGK